MPAAASAAPLRAIGAGGTSEALIRAARSEFVAKGYGGASTRAIQRVAGVTAPVLYHHFGSKGGLYVAVARAAMDDVTTEFEARLAGAHDWHGLQDAVLRAACALQRRDPDLAVFVTSAPPDLARNSELRPAIQEMGRLRGVLDAACRKLLGPRARADRGTRLLLATIYGMGRFAGSMTPRAFERLADDIRSTSAGELS